MAILTRKQVFTEYEGRTGHSLADEADEVRDGIYLAWTSFEFFLERIFFPYHLHGIWTPETVKATRLYGFQRKLANIAQYELPKYGKIVIEAPTGSTKTDTIAMGYTLWRAVRDPSVRIGLYGHDADKTKRHMTKFMAHLESNRGMRDVFGSLVDAQHKRQAMWGIGELQLRQIGGRGNITITACSFGGESEGLPFDVIIGDDVQGSKEVATPEQCEKSWRWWTEVVVNRLRPDTEDPEDGVICSIGTRQAAGDIHARCADEEDWKVYHFRAIERHAVPKDARLGTKGLYKLERNEDGRLVPVALWDNFKRQPKILLPERRGFRYGELCWEQERHPLQFARKKQNLVLDEKAKLFPLKLLREYCRADGRQDPEGRLKPRLRAWNIHEGRPDDYPLEFKRLILSVDLAATAKIKGRYDPDYSVFLLLGVTKERLRVVLDILRIRTGDPAKLRDCLLQRYTRYHPTIPPVVESNACQRLWAKDVTGELGIPVRLEELKASRIDEIESAADLARCGLLLYAWDEDDPYTLSVMKAFEDELTGYPGGRHDDQLTAFILAERHVIKGGEIEAAFPNIGATKRESAEPTDADEVDVAALAQRIKDEKLAGRVAQLDADEVERLEFEGRLPARTHRRGIMPRAQWLN